MEVMALGFFALCVLALSVCCLCYKRPFLSLVSSVVVTVLTCFTGAGWRTMLINSGKDPALFGFVRYPAALVLLSVLLFGAVVTMIVSTIMMVRRRQKSRNVSTY